MGSGGVLVMPPFKRSAKGFQFTSNKNMEAYKIARVRVHEERAIRRMKVFTSLDYVTSDMREFMDDILVVVSSLCNLSTDLIARK